MTIDADRVVATIQEDQEMKIRAAFDEAVAKRSRLCAWLLKRKKFYALAVRLWDIKAECETSTDLKVEYRFFMRNELIGTYKTTVGLMLQ